MPDETHPARLSTIPRSVPLSGRLSASRRFRSLLPIVVLTLLLLSGCGTRVSGFESPMAHDYGPVAWLPLETTVMQPFVAGPGYSEAVANDATTTPLQFQQRLRALPADARTGELTELHVGLRLSEERDGPWQTGARLQLIPDPKRDLRFPEGDFHAWPEDQVWLPEVRSGYVAGQSFVSPYPMLSGILLRIATFGGDLSPGQATVGSDGAPLLALPIDGDPLAELAPGQIVDVTGSLEGWAQVRLADGRTGFASLEAFASLPPAADPPAAPLMFTLTDERGAVLRSVEIAPGWLHDNSHLKIEFDPLTDSAGKRYQMRLSLPDTAAGGRLTVRATAGEVYAEGERLDEAGPVANDLVFRPLYAEAPPLLDVSVDDLEREGDWLRAAGTDVESGQIIAVRLVPGSGADSGSLQYGVASDRAPTGAWSAMTTDDTQLSGALLVRTRYERDVAIRSVLSGGVQNLRQGARDDLPFMALYALAFVALIASAVWLTRSRPVGEAER